jgi:hypothetical protein
MYENTLYRERMRLLGVQALVTPAEARIGATAIATLARQDRNQSNTQGPVSRRRTPGRLPSPTSASPVRAPPK